jgi:S1-C subfamily serine protease
MIEFICECGQKLKVSNDLAGWSTQCTGCKELVSVPSPEDPAQVQAKAKEPVRPAMEIPWKGIAIGASSVAVIAILVAVFSGGSKAPDEDLAFTLTKLKNQVADQDREISSLKAERSKQPDAAKLEQRARQAETERDKLRAQLDEAFRQLRNARTSEPAPPIPAPSEPAAKAAEPEPKPKADSSNQEPGRTDYSDAEVMERCAGAVVFVGSDRGSGGGFFVTQDGLTVTNYKTVAGSLACKVIYVSGAGADRVVKEAEARVVAVDAKNDLALLKADVPRLVTCAQLQTGWGVSVEQELLLIENPPQGTKSVQHGMNKGGVIALDHVVEGFKFIQTAIPMSSANMGVPLFNRAAKVVGMTTQRGEASTLAATVLPVTYVVAFLEGRETTFALGMPLKEWEEQPKTGGTTATLAADPDDIKVEGMISRFILDEENDRFVCLDIEKNGVAVVSLSKKKTLRTIPTGANPTELQATGNPMSYWASHVGGRNIVKVNVEEGRVYDRVDIPGPFRRFAASQNHVWAFGNEVSYMVPLGRGDKKAVPTSDRISSLGYDRRRDRLIGILSGWSNWRMVEIENPDKLGRLFKEIHEIRSGGKDHPRYKELEDLEKEGKALMKVWPAPPETSEWFQGGYTHSIVIDGSPLVYINRSVIKATKLDSIVATFNPPPFRGRGLSAVSEDSLAKVALFDRIQSGSPDGRWVATGKHIWSTETFSVHKELPCLTPTSAFSGDSKKLYYFDPGKRAIVKLDVESK